MNNYIKIVLLGCLFLLSGSALSAQIGLELRPGYNDDRCPGFNDQENIVIIDIVNELPVPPTANTRIEYYWVITHELGNWAYQTNNSARGFQLSFPGQYTMRCQVLYVDLHTTFAYASFWSSPLIVNTGDSCE